MLPPETVAKPVPLASLTVAKAVVKIPFIVLGVEAIVPPAEMSIFSVLWALRVQVFPKVSVVPAPPFGLSVMPLPVLAAKATAPSVCAVVPEEFPLRLSVPPPKVSADALLMIVELLAKSNSNVPALTAVAPV